MPAEMTMGCEMSDGIRKRKRKELELYELPGNKNIRVQEQLENKREDIVSIPSDSECEDVGNGIPNDEVLELDEVVIKQLLSNSKKSQSFAAIPSELQSLCFITQAWITDYTFFRLPFLSSLDVINLIHESWKIAQDEEKSYLWRTKDSKVYTPESDPISCMSTYGHRFRASEIVTAIYELFFQRQKIRGNRDPTFFDKINSVFICLVALALQHCLKEWKTGERTKVLVDYKYETAAASYYRLRNTWALYDKKVGKLILANIKADLRTRIGRFDKKAEVESSEPCTVVENRSYLDELQQELQMTMEI
ncbi:hypothetical protein EV426DRAFT_701826 [Tirmania nivea]|nr:hypothetical protein EV426DRAFT_701826 [Tirmania nivea]